MKFEWDAAKNRTNLEKRGVSFDEAALLLSSATDCLEIFDEARSLDEERFISVGPISR